MKGQVIIILVDDDNYLRYGTAAAIFLWIVGCIDRFLVTVNPKGSRFTFPAILNSCYWNEMNSLSLLTEIRQLTVKIVTKNSQEGSMTL